MRSFASILVVVSLCTLPAVARAQTPSPRTIYTDALLQERTLRQELEKRRSDVPAPALLKRMRSLVETYERMSRQFPTGSYMDNALWQGALLASDAFWTFGEAEDRARALGMFSELTSRFPRSPLINDAPSHVKRLSEARLAPSESKSASPARASAPVAAVSSSRPANPLTAVRREVLDDALRVTLELGEEVSFRSDRLDGPPRVFIDFDNTRPVEAIKDATITFTDDVVRKIRIGRPTESRTRVVMDLTGAGRHSIYTLYNPYRVVIDFARVPAGSAGVVGAAALPAAAAPVVQAVRPSGSKTDTAVPASSSASAPPAAVPAVAELTNDTAPPPATSAPRGPSPPAAPSAKGSSGVSLSRQLGLRVSRVVIDPGHGGHDPGAKTKGLTEADLVLDVALRLEKLLAKQDGVEVVLTRRADTFVPLEERTAIANREGADLFLSIHANASANGTARGVETYFLNLTANPDAEMVAARENSASSRSMNQLSDIVKAIALNNKIQESRDFAAMIQTSLSSQLQKTDGSVRNLGVKQAPFMVLLGATMPSVLAEISFITNKQDATLLKTEKHRQRIAEALHAGVLRYQQSLRSGPALAEQ
jgi:N-acetylmuramoyl-L-alanine amidase